MLFNAMVALYRGKLKDTRQPYLWDNSDLQTYVNQSINQLCRKLPLIVDSTQFSLLAGATSITTSGRIVNIIRAKLTSQTYPMEGVWTVQDMDAQVPGWDSAEDGVPTRLVIGTGNNLVRLWPPTEDADTLTLTVSRLPLVDLSLATVPMPSPEISELFHDQLEHGVLAQAYLKDGVDTLDMSKSAIHKTAWDDQIEEIKRSWLVLNSYPVMASPHSGCV